MNLRGTAGYGATVQHHKTAAVTVDQYFNCRSNQMTATACIADVGPTAH
jgi:hypothetical protein